MLWSCHMGIIAITFFSVEKDHFWVNETLAIIKLGILLE